MARIVLPRSVEIRVVFEKLSLWVVLFESLGCGGAGEL
jgi:hypothetical protein